MRLYPPHAQIHTPSGVPQTHYIYIYIYICTFQINFNISLYHMTLLDTNHLAVTAVGPKFQEFPGGFGRQSPPLASPHCRAPSLHVQLISALACKVSSPPLGGSCTPPARGRGCKHIRAGVAPQAPPGRLQRTHVSLCSGGGWGTRWFGRRYHPQALSGSAFQIAPSPPPPRAGRAAAFTQALANTSEAWLDELAAVLRAKLTRFRMRPVACVC